MSAKEDAGVTLVSVDEQDDEVMRDNSCQTIPEISDDDAALQRTAYEEAIASVQKVQNVTYEEGKCLRLLSLHALSPDRKAMLT